MNEPGLEVNYERTTMEAFGKWLEQRYGSVDRLNQRWFQPLQSFSDVQLNPDQWTARLDGLLLLRRLEAVQH